MEEMIAGNSRRLVPQCRLRYLIVLLLWLMMTATPALGKMPPFIVTVDPNPPVAGEPTTISAEFGASFPVEELNGLLVLYRLDGDEDRKSELPITLSRVGSARYEATVVIPSAGRWVLKAFPDRTGWPTQEVPSGYPDTIELEVVAPGAAGSVLGQRFLGQIRLDLTVVILLGIVGLRYWLNHRVSLFGDGVETA